MKIFKLYAEASSEHSCVMRELCYNGIRINNGKFQLVNYTENPNTNPSDYGMQSCAENLVDTSEKCGM